MTKSFAWLSIFAYSLLPSKDLVNKSTKVPHMTPSHAAGHVHKHIHNAMLSNQDF